MNLRCIYLAIHISRLFLVVDEYSFAQFGHNLFIHLLVDGHLSCFYLGAIMYKLL